VCSSKQHLPSSLTLSPQRLEPSVSYFRSQTATTTATTTTTATATTTATTTTTTPTTTTTTTTVWIPWVCCIPIHTTNFYCFRGCATITHGMPIFNNTSNTTRPNHAATPQFNLDDSSIVTDREGYLRILRIFQFPCMSIFDTTTCRFRTKWVSSAQFPSNFFPIVHIYSLRLQTSQITTNLQMPRTGPPTTILQPRQQGQPITTSALTASQEQFFVVATAI
jgi:hypothetical protein